MSDADAREQRYQEGIEEAVECGSLIVDRCDYDLDESDGLVLGLNESGKKGRDRDGGGSTANELVLFTRLGIITVAGDEATSLAQQLPDPARQLLPAFFSDLVLRHDRHREAVFSQIARCYSYGVRVGSSFYSAEHVREVTRVLSKAEHWGILRGVGFIPE